MQKILTGKILELRVANTLSLVGNQVQMMGLTTGAQFVESGKPMCVCCESKIPRKIVSLQQQYNTHVMCQVTTQSSSFHLQIMLSTFTSIFHPTLQHTATRHLCIAYTYLWKFETFSWFHPKIQYTATTHLSIALTCLQVKLFNVLSCRSITTAESDVITVLACSSWNK
jgi:hypothetical protein